MEKVRANASILTASQMALATEMCSPECDQSQLFEHWPMGPEEDGDKKRAQMVQMETLNANYPNGGLAKYVSNAKKLLKASKEGKNPFDGWQPSVPKGEHVEYGSEKHAALERVGLKQAKKTAFVLVAGGLGERLGYKGTVSYTHLRAHET